MNVEDAVGGAPDDIAGTGEDQLLLAVQELQNAYAMPNCESAVLLTLFPGRKTTDTLARSVLERAGFTISGVPESSIKLSYGFEPGKFPEALSNAESMEDLSKALVGMAVKGLGSLFVFCDEPGAEIFVSSRNACGKPIPARGFQRKTTDGFAFKVGSMMETSIEVSKAAQAHGLVKSFMSGLSGVGVLIILQEKDIKCTPALSTLLLFHDGPLGPLVDVRTHVHVVPGII